MSNLDRSILYEVFNSPEPISIDDLSGKIRADKVETIKAAAHLIKQELIDLKYLHHKCHFAMLPKGTAAVLLSCVVRGDATLPEGEDAGDVSTHLLEFADRPELSVGNGGRTKAAPSRPHELQAPVNSAVGVAGVLETVNRIAPEPIPLRDLMFADCPQGEDCLGDGLHRRLFQCQFCDFKGCAMCLDAHLEAGHAEPARPFVVIQGGKHL